MKQWNLFSCRHCVEPNAAHFPGCCPTSANSKKKENSKRERENDGLQRTHWREWIWTSSELPFPVLTFWRWITMCCTFLLYLRITIFFCRGSDVQIIMSVSLAGLILIHTVREALFRTDTYWLQEVYFRAECLPQKLQLSSFMRVQLLPRPGKQMKPTWVTERVVGKKRQNKSRERGNL